ncbi:hypothetical protein [Puniceicoccus vermicola]|uniref:Uncharacterized protein n=1 Tax=Puniceicoccus vermicola TaxID=388746 RepID=A0A7X1B184_9BACT|nr:hypothetical protein [Puniceicoccus vermicola]MBC2603751.1 hypothetical protein [Puniceicoccus vermicola]
MDIKHYKYAVGKTIKKIGIDPHKYSLRIILDDDTMLWVTVGTGDEFLLGAGVHANVRPKNSFGDMDHVEWFDSSFSERKGVSCSDSPQGGDKTELIPPTGSTPVWLGGLR